MADPAPIFLTLEQVLELHASRIALYGGSLGVRDKNLLESAIHAPAARFGGEFLHHDLGEMAAAYAFSLTRDHPFIDGNKRTAALAAFVFLDLNGIELEADETEFGDIILAVASGQAGKEELTAFFRRHIPGS